MEYHPATASLSLGEDAIALPSDYLELIYLQLIKDNVRYTVAYRESPLRMYAEMQDVTETGIPTAVTRVADDLVFDVLTDAVYTRDWAYYRRLTVLSAAAPNNTNWWSESAEEAFLMSCLNKASLYVTGISEGDKAKWKEAYALNLERLRLREAWETTGGNVIRSTAWTI